MNDMSAFGVIHKVWPLPAGAVAHGTGMKAAKSIARTGLKDTKGAHGVGAYTSPNHTEASVFATQRSKYNPKVKASNVNHDGLVVGRERRKGRVAFFSPKAKPVATVPESSGQMPINVYHGKDLGKPVHIQNVNRTTVARTRAREMGVAPDKPQPVKSLADPGERARRLGDFRRKKQIASTPVSDWN